LLALGEDLCLDYVSQPEAFSRLYPKLRAGYLLDARIVGSGLELDDELLQLCAFTGDERSGSDRET